MRRGAQSVENICYHCLVRLHRLQAAFLVLCNALVEKWIELGAQFGLVDLGICASIPLVKAAAVVV
jgi:hypothetical protein